jgi:hypothetical protein
VTFSVWSGQFAAGLFGSLTDPAWAPFFVANIAVCSLVVFLTLRATAPPT